MEQTLTAWLAQFGAPALFALLMLGVFGLPIPDETVLLLAGVLVSRGDLLALPTALAAMGGAMAGITVSYGLGRFAGLTLLTRYGAAMHVSPDGLARVHRWFGRFGKWLLTAGYFVPGVRHVTAIVAGASGLSGWTFSAFAYAGALLWVSCFLSIGYALGDRGRAIVADLHRYLAAGGAATAAGVLVYALWSARRRRRRHRVP